MRLRSLGLGLVLGLGLGPVVGCDGGSEPTVTPESLDKLVLHDSYGDLLVTMLIGLRDGDLAQVRNSIATQGQIETMCTGYPAPGQTPYDPPSIVAAADHCKQVFGPIPQDVLDASFADHPYGVSMDPPIDYAFEAYWLDRCPEDFRVYQLVGIFEARGEGLPQAGFEVNGVFSYRGQWGLMSIPRCRGEGE